MKWTANLSTTASTRISRWSSSCGKKSVGLPGRWWRGAAMAEYLLLAAGFVLATVALGLVRILRGAERRRPV